MSADGPGDSKKISIKSKLIIILVLSVSLLIGMRWLFVGFTKSEQLDRKHRISSAMGLERSVYWAHPTDSTKDMKWEGRFKIEHTSNGISFLNEESKTVLVGTGYYAIEK